MTPLVWNLSSDSFFHKVFRFLNRLADRIDRSTTVASHPDIDKVKITISLAKKYLDATNEQDYNRAREWHDQVIIFSYNLSDELKNNIISCLAIQSSETYFLDILSNQIQAAAVNLLTCRQWLFLSDLFRYRARYYLAHLCRDKALYLALEPFSVNRSDPPISWRNSISAALESGNCRDHDTLEEMLDLAKIRFLRRKKWHLYLAILNGEVKNYKGKNIFLDTRFQNFIKDKAVAILGPARSSANERIESEPHNIEIRMNYRFDNEKLGSQLKARRNSIFYLNGEMGSDFVKGNEIFGLHSKNWLCFKGRWAAKRCVKKFKYVNCRVFANFDDMMFHGTLNMAPSVILDLVLHDAKNIHLCNTDLYLSVQYYKGDDVIGIREANLIHDPILQYHVLNRLWNSNVFAPDKRLKDILSHGLTKYLLELEKIYS